MWSILPVLVIASTISLVYSDPQLMVKSKRSAYDTYGMQPSPYVYQRAQPAPQYPYQSPYSVQPKSVNYNTPSIWKSDAGYNSEFGGGIFFGLIRSFVNQLPRSIRNIALFFLSPIERIFTFFRRIFGSVFGPFKLFF